MILDRLLPPDLESSYRDRVVIVTGATTGIGRGLCEELGRLGARVVVTGRDLTRAGAVVEAIHAGGGLAQARELDVTREDQFRAVIEETVDEHGRLDLLFNNAGLFMAGRAEAIPPERWDQLLDINLRGTITGSRLAWELMVRQGHGHIINVASQAGLMPVPTFAPYVASKHGIVGLSTSLRMEGRRHGVRVSVVCPGYVRSAMLDKGLYLGLERSAAEKLLYFKPWETERAVVEILRGVARDEAFIVFPFYARFFWRLYRYLPGLYFFSARYTT